MSNDDFGFNDEKNCSWFFLPFFLFLFLLTAHFLDIEFESGPLIQLSPFRCHVFFSRKTFLLTSSSGSTPAVSSLVRDETFLVAFSFLFQVIISLLLQFFAVIFDIYLENFYRLHFVCVQIFWSNIINFVDNNKSVVNLLCWLHHIRMELRLPENCLCKNDKITIIYCESNEDFVPLCCIRRIELLVKFSLWIRISI